MYFRKNVYKISSVKTINSYGNDQKLKTRVNQTIISHTIKMRNHKRVR